MSHKTLPLTDHYDVKRGEDGHRYLRPLVRGFNLTRIPLLNKGTAFSEQEREELGLDGLLAPQVDSLEVLVERAYREFLQQDTPLGQHVYLRDLQDRNEVLFYALLSHHVAHEAASALLDPLGAQHDGRGGGQRAAQPFELALLQLGIGAHAAVAISAGELEHAVIELVETGQGHELEFVAHRAQLALDDVGIGPGVLAAAGDRGGLADRAGVVEGELAPVTGERLAERRQLERHLHPVVAGQRSGLVRPVLEPLAVLHRQSHPKADLALLQRAYVSPVLTAHPSEVRRKSVIDRIAAISGSCCVPRSHNRKQQATTAVSRQISSLEAVTL